MHTSFVRSFVRLLTCAHPHRVHREDINYSMEGKLTTCIHLNSLRRGLVNFFNTFCATSNNQVYAIARYSSLHFNSNHWSLFGGYSGVFFSAAETSSSSSTKSIFVDTLNFGYNSFWLSLLEVLVRDALRLWEWHFYLSISVSFATIRFPLRWKKVTLALARQVYIPEHHQ